MSLTARPKTAILAPVIVAEFCGKPLEVKWDGKVSTPEAEFNGEKIVGIVSIVEALAKDTDLSKLESSELIKLAVEKITNKADFKALGETLTQVEAKLDSSTYLLGSEISLGDIFIYAHIACHPVCNNMIKKGDFEN